MDQIDAERLFRPNSEALRFLPEGPSNCGAGQFSWVAIQHGPESTCGSLNIYDLDGQSNTHFPLDGRPGFAFATDRAGMFVVGLERRVELLDISRESSHRLVEGVDVDVDNTIINDGLALPEGLIFGTKDLQFQQRKAGLYFWRRADATLIRLAGEQICSNGKAVVEAGGERLLLDIDSPTKQLAAYPLDVEQGKLGERRVMLDLTDVPMFPDGMILAPDGQSVIIAFYNPEDAPYGEARQYALAGGQWLRTWRTPGSPQVTCPQLVAHRGRVKLILTTAVEHMPAERQARHPDAGCLFVAETPFEHLGAAAERPWPAPEVELL